jgi:tRNA 2-thiouridine synthesizing protein A
VSAQPAPDVVVDARGLRCPLPVIRLAEAARHAEGGTLVEVLATDPAAKADIPAWCRMRGQQLVEVRDAEGEVAGEGGHTAYRIRLVAS